MTSTPLDTEAIEKLIAEWSDIYAAPSDIQMLAEVLAEVKRQAGLLAKVAEVVELSKMLNRDELDAPVGYQDGALDAHEWFERKLDHILNGEQELPESVAIGLAQSAAGDVVELGSFAQYAGDEGLPETEATPDEAYDIGYVAGHTAGCREAPVYNEIEIAGVLATFTDMPTWWGGTEFIGVARAVITYLTEGKTDE